MQIFYPFNIPHIELFWNTKSFWHLLIWELIELDRREYVFEIKYEIERSTRDSTYSCHKFIHKYVFIHKFWIFYSGVFYKLEFGGSKDDIFNNKKLKFWTYYYTFCTAAVAKVWAIERQNNDKNFYGSLKLDHRAIWWCDDDVRLSNLIFSLTRKNNL